MKSISCLMFVVSAALFVGSASAVNFAWQDCGGSILHFNKLDVSPLPMVISETAKLYLTTNLTMTEDLPVNAEFELEINKTVIVGGKGFPITLPCIDGMGSCRAKVCDLFHLWYNDFICPFFKSAGKTCACPVAKGTYIDQKVEVDVPFSKFQGILAQLADGDYSAKFTITDPAKSKLFACLNLQAHLTIHK